MTGTTIASAVVNGVTLTNPAYNPVTVLSGVDITNAGGAALTGDGTTTYWTIANSGTIQATGSGAGSDGIVLAAMGSITNADGALISGYQIGVSIAGAGTVMNAGAISASQLADNTTTGYGYLYSSSPFSLAVLDGGVVMAGGTVSNASSGSITDYAFGIGLTQAGTVINQGRITGSGAHIGSGIILADGGSIDNAGGTVTGAAFGIIALAGGQTTITNQGSLSGAREAVYLIAGGTIGNQGTITGGERAGVYLSNTGVVSNTGTGAITASGAQAIGIWLAGGGSAYNSGSIVAADGIALQKTGGSATNATGGMISASNLGIYIGGTAGTAANYGTIIAPFAVDLRPGGAVTNGASAAIEGGAYGVLVSGGTGTVNNSGTISASYITNGSTTFNSAGIAVYGGGDVTNAQGATVTAKWIGVQIGAKGGSVGGTLDNQGYIFASDGTNGAAAWIRGPGLISNGSTGTITGGPYGVVAYYEANTVVNQGTITATYKGVVNSGGGSVLNQGLISVSGADAQIGIALGGTAMVTNTSSGRIVSPNTGISFTGTLSGSTLLNSGTIEGGVYAVYTAAGLTERIIVTPGAVFDGVVSGGKAEGALTSVLELPSASTAGAITGFNAHYIGFGEIEVDAGATWSVSGFIGSAQTLDFAGTGDVLTLDNPGTIEGTIDGFVVGDSIVLEGVTGVTSATLDGSNLLTVADGGAPLTLQFNTAQSFSGPDFGFSAVTGGTELTAPCFAEGTRLRTEHGERAVESLRPGDRVATAGGMARILWIGHRGVACRRHPRPADVQPVRISRGAFGPGRPARELRLSPDHAVFVDDVLIPIRYLVNGASITQEDVDAVTYWHVELASHGVLLAEGLPCESYLDTGNRGAFDDGEGAAPIMLHPDFALRVWDAESCAPLLRDGEALVAVRHRLLERAAAIGHVATGDADLRLMAGDRVIRPDITGRTWRFRLPAASGAMRLVSRSAVPAQCRADGRDHRRLGVAVAAIRLDGRALALTDARLSSGWHDNEADFRWTDGDAGLALAGVRVLEIDVAMTERYWLEGEQAAAGVTAVA